MSSYEAAPIHLRDAPVDRLQPANRGHTERHGACRDRLAAGLSGRPTCLDTRRVREVCHPTRIHLRNSYCKRQLYGQQRRHIDHGKQRTAVPYRTAELQPSHIIAPAVYTRDHDPRHIRLAGR
jgi:hypothetical protein